MTGAAFRLMIKHSAVARREVLNIVATVIRKEVNNYRHMTEEPLQQPFNRAGLQSFDWAQTHQSLRQHIPTLYKVVVVAATAPKVEKEYK